MNIILISMLFLTILLIAGCTKTTILDKDTLPSTFNMHLYSDGTSSGGNRIYNISLKFENSILESAYFIYDFAGYDDEKNQPLVIHHQCVLTSDINGQYWGSVPSGESKGRKNCHVSPDFVPLNKAELQEKINSGEFKKYDPIADCPHGDICYELII